MQQNKAKSAKHFLTNSSNKRAINSMSRIILEPYLTLNPKPLPFSFELVFPKFTFQLKIQGKQAVFVKH